MFMINLLWRIKISFIITTFCRSYCLWLNGIDVRIVFDEVLPNFLTGSDQSPDSPLAPRVGSCHHHPLGSSRKALSPVYLQLFPSCLFIPHMHLEEELSASTPTDATCHENMQPHHRAKELLEMCWVAAFTRRLSQANDFAKRCIEEP